jgi:putative FmdB family regulatory protein
MPTYEYYCEGCDYEFELLQSIKAESFTNCPKCNKKLERKISLPAGLVFKGSGFYITDYKNHGKSGSSITQPADKNSGSKTKTETSENSNNTKTESKDKSASSEKSSSTEKSVSKTETKTVTT